MVAVLLVPSLLGMARAADSSPFAALDRELALSICAPTGEELPSGTDPAPDHHDTLGCVLCAVSCAACATCASCSTTASISSLRVVSTSASWRIAHAAAPRFVWMVANRPRGPPAFWLT
jgi:hypothetical protein